MVLYLLLLYIYEGRSTITNPFATNRCPIGTNVRSLISVEIVFSLLSNVRLLYEIDIRSQSVQVYGYAGNNLLSEKCIKHCLNYSNPSYPYNKKASYNILLMENMHIW